MNARVLQVPSNGQKRVAVEISQRLGFRKISPASDWASGMRGHLWEQSMLPALAHGRPLWNPSTSGPVFYGNQVVTIHDIAFVDVPEFFNKNFAKFYDAVTRQIVSRARHIIAVSEFTRQRLIEHYAAREDRVTCIHSGSTAAFYPRSEEQVQAARTTYDLGSAPYVVGFLGSDPRKNTARLLKAWAAGRFHDQGCRLVLFGRLSNKRVFAAEGSLDLGPGVIHAQDVSDEMLATLYSGAAGFVFPSLYEGFGLPVIEAASCGARVVTSNLSSLPEVSPPDTILIDPLSLDEISGAIAHLLFTSDTTERRLARIKAGRGFDWDVTAETYRTLFERMFS